MKVRVKKRFEQGGETYEPGKIAELSTSAGKKAIEKGEADYVKETLWTEEVSYEGRLSDLQKSILLAIATYTVNRSECKEAEYVIGLYPYHDPIDHGMWKEQFVNYSDVSGKVFLSHWNPLNAEHNINDKKVRSKSASFSRSVHNLVENKKLVSAFALRWHLIGTTPDGRLTKEAWSWQGGGCRTTDDRGIKTDTPNYKKLGLNQRGWRIVREIDETAGMCPRLKEYLFEEEWNMLVEWWRERRKARGLPERKERGENARC